MIDVHIAHFKMQGRMYQSFGLLGLALIKSKLFYLCCTLFSYIHLLSTSVVHSLLVTPPLITEVEGHSKVHFFCRENDNTFAIKIVWQDPLENVYIPGSGGNLRISAEGSRLSIINLICNDTGIYRCLNIDNHTEFAEGHLTVNGI